jgi:sec-independent protein translocase protein TatB
MLDIGWTELLVIAVVLIVIVGPKDLPPMLRAFGKMTSNLRKMAGDFRTQFDEALREADMDDVRQTISDAQRLNPANALREAMNPLREMGNEIRNDLQKATSVPPLSEIGKKPDEDAVDNPLDELLPLPEMSLPETPPLATSPAPPATGPVATPSMAAASSAAVSAAGPAVTGASSATASASVAPGTGAVTAAPAATVPTETAAKKPRAPRKASPSGAEADAVAGAVKRTRTAKAIAEVAAESSPATKPARKRIAKAIDAAAEPEKPVRARKKPATPKDEA